jgi:STAS domain
MFACPRYALRKTRFRFGTGRKQWGVPSVVLNQPTPDQPYCRKWRDVFGNVALDAEEPVNFIDISAADELLSLIKELQSRGITVAFARVRDVVRDDMRLAGIERIVGPSNFHERTTDGVRAWHGQGSSSVASRRREAHRVRAKSCGQAS